MSEGQRLLRLMQVSDTQLGKLVGIGRITVNGWRTGRVKPGLDNRRKLEKLFDIKIANWDMVPQDKSPVIRNFAGAVIVPKNAPPQRAVPPPHEMGADMPLEAPDMSAMSELPIRKLVEYGSKHSDPLPESREGIEQLLRSLRSARNNPEMLPTDRVKLATAETRAYEMIRKMDKDNEMAEDRIIRQHPKWKRMQSAMIAALKPFPDAMRAVVEALRALEVE